MEKVECPICHSNELQKIQDLHAAYYLPENEENGVRGQNSIYISQYVCTKCGYLLQRAEGKNLEAIKTFYSNTHREDNSSGSYPINFDAMNKCNRND